MNDNRNASGTQLLNEEEDPWRITMH
jgi:hypothetical protein